MAYQHKNKKGENYFLHKKDVKLRGSGKQQTIYFFSRKVGQGSLDEVPTGFAVIEVKKSGLPLLKRK